MEEKKAKRAVAFNIRTKEVEEVILYDEAAHEKIDTFVSSAITNAEIDSITAH